MGIRIIRQGSFILLVLVLNLFLTMTCLADGKIYIPLEEFAADIPYQRAFLIFENKQQTLMLQSQYDIPRKTKETNMGWVVPVPAVPEITTMAEDTASHFFELLAIHSSPEVNRILPEIFGMILIFMLLGSLSFILLLSVVTLIRCVAARSFKPLKSINTNTSMWFKYSAYMFLFGLLAAVAVPSYKSLEPDDVEVVKAEMVGIYEIKVIRSNNSAALVDWLNNSGFKYNSNDINVFENYIKKNWCFVVAKIKTIEDSDDSTTDSKGLVAPLILAFETETPVYPLALTATSGHDTQVLLYSFCESKMKSDGRLKMQFAGEYHSPYLNILNGLAANNEAPYRKDHYKKFFPVEMNGYLTKFKGTLNPEQMKLDLYLQKSEDNTPYRLKVTRWF